MENYIGIIATLIGVCATFIVGFQIIDSLTINRKLRKIEKLQKETQIQLTIQKNVTQENICIFNGLEIMEHVGCPLKRPSLAFLQFHQALVYSIEIDRDDYDWLFDYLNKCIDDLTYNDFEERTIIDGNQKKRIRDGIDIFMKEIICVENSLKKSKNFVKIKPIYRQMRKNLDAKLEDIANLKQE